MLLDIRADHLKIVQDILRNFVPDREVWAFGSRAKWLAKEYSDLDLCIVGDTALSFSTLGLMEEAFDDSDLPYKVDVVDWATTSESFRKIIERDRVVVQHICQGWAKQSDWRDLTLGEFVRLQRGHDLTASEQRPGQFPVMGSAGPNGTHSEFKAPGPGVVIGRSGASMGRVHYCDENYWPHNTCMYVTDFLGNNPLFVCYKLAELNLASYNSGSAQPSLNRNYIYGMSLRVPDRRLQDKIVSTVDSVDKKIHLNRRISQSLEAMAQAIFKSWFVDFDPVKAKIAAKAEGRDPLRAAMTAISGKPNAGIDTLPPEQLATLAATAALFPDEIEDSELGEIPKGWTVQSMAQLTSKIGSGSTPRGGKEVYLDEGIALIRSQNVYDSLFVWEGLARITDEAAAQLKGVTVQENDVLLNITGASILRTCVVLPDVLPARVNQHVAIIRAKAGVPARFLHQHLLLPETKNHLLGLNAGGSREAVTKAHIESLTLLVPTDALLDAFEALVSPVFKQVESCAREMRSLAALRDALLPKLLSGELQVDTTEVEATA